MTQLNDPAADAATPEGQTPAGDPELAALVRGNAPADVVDPSLAALLSSPPTAFAATDAASIADTTTADASPAGERTAVAADAGVGESVVEPVPVPPIAAAVTEAAPRARPRRRRAVAFRFGAAFLVGLVLAVGIGAGAMYAWDQQYVGRVLPGVSIAGTDVGGLTREQAMARIAEAYASLGSGQVVLTGPDGDTTTISYADLGRGPDTTALVDAALAVGRQGDILATLVDQPRIALHGVTLDARVVYDHDKLAATIAALASTIDQTPVDAKSAAADGDRFTVSPSKDGRQVDQAALSAALDQQLGALGTPASIALSVPVVPLAPAISTESAEAAKAAADRMAADLVISRGNESWTIERASLAPLISFAQTVDGTDTALLDTTGLDPLVDRLAHQIYQKRQDAGFKLVNGRVVARGSSQEGRTLDRAGMKAAILSALNARRLGTPAAPVEAVVRAAAPRLSAADAKALAPKMKVISSFSIYYYVIVNNHFGGNIEAPATKLNGVVVPAGAVFDFWKEVGDLRKLPGTGPGNAIEGGKITVTGAFGGGICTTSTTLFNAAFRAGMIPMARKNHNEFIDRYPAGLDATVWIVGDVKQTMSFKNDTEYPVMITRNVRQDGNRRWLTFKIWSVPNGRKATVTNTVIQPGARAIDTTVRDPKKPVGYYFRNNSPVDGAKVWTTVTIYDHGKLHWQKRFYSNYPAVNGVLIVGSRRT